MLRKIALFIVCILLSQAGMAHSQKQPKHPVPPHVAIASASPYATDAGMKILKEGGNAFDAAVTIAAVLAVTEPYNSGLGGGGFWLVYCAKDKHYAFIDSREVAPLAARANMYLDRNGRPIEGASLNGPLAAAIPGEVAGMVYLAKHYGKLPLSKSLEPAIKYASKGFEVDKYYQKAASMRLAALLASPAAAQQFLDHGLVPAIGYMIKQPNLAKVLEAIAKEGNKGFYQGPIAKQLVDGVRSAGGIWQLKDLSNYKVVVRKPLIGQFHHVKVIVSPPPSAGGVALLTMLNIISGYDLLSDNKVDRVHLLTEAMRRAFNDRAKHLGDPDFYPVPTERLISQQHADELGKDIDLNKATTLKSEKIYNNVEGEDTTHFSVLDEKGNRVAATLSLNYAFGSGFVPPGTGVLLNDQMDDFSTKVGAKNLYNLPGHESNIIVPGKRPLSSMSPTFLETKDKVAILGTPGGSRIITMVLMGIIDFTDGNKPLSWVTIPRFHHQSSPNQISHEKGAFKEQEKQALQQKGHLLKQTDRLYGNMQAILWDLKRNKVYAASDPRGGGKAIVEK